MNRVDILLKHIYLSQNPSSAEMETSSSTDSLKEDEIRIAVIGSSVACGAFAQNDQGWAYQLQKALSRRSRKYKVFNVAQSGTDTSATKSRFHSVISPIHPHIVIISLSLANEGLLYRGKGACLSFESGLKKLIQFTQEAGAIPILGSVYPNNSYLPKHYGWLKETNQEMKKWGFTIIDFLSAMDDGNGHWKSGTNDDDGHPNDYGHQLMFEAIPLDIFEEVLQNKK